MIEFDSEAGPYDSSESDSVDARARRESRLRSRALRNAIFNSANFWSIATDAEGVIQIFNFGAERMLGYEAIEVIDKITPADISDPREVVERAKALSIELGATILPGFEALIFNVSRGIEETFELTYIRKDGSRFPAVVSVTALRDPSRNIIGYLLVGTDNSARKRIDDEHLHMSDVTVSKQMDQVLLERNIDLQIAKVAAEKANLSKSEFLSSMSHELRSPLNAILGFAQLLESESPPPTPSQLESIGRILQAGWHLLNLINEILDLAKIESGKFSLSPEPVSLPEVLVECKGMIDGLAQKRGIGLEFPTFATPCFAHADRTRLKQILLNLLSNAIKYNREQGQVVISVMRTDSGMIRIEIRDTGDGLLPAQLQLLFQPFNRPGQDSRGEEGKGIGLVVAKQLVEIMGGTISANAMPHDIARGMKAGFYRYLAKPIKLLEFNNALDAALEFAAHHRQHSE